MTKQNLRWAKIQAGECWEEERLLPLCWAAPPPQADTTLKDDVSSIYRVQHQLLTVFFWLFSFSLLPCCHLSKSPRTHRACSSIFFSVFEFLCVAWLLDPRPPPLRYFPLFIRLSRDRTIFKTANVFCQTFAHFLGEKKLWSPLNLETTKVLLSHKILSLMSFNHLCSSCGQIKK